MLHCYFSYFYDDIDETRLMVNICNLRSEAAGAGWGGGGAESTSRTWTQQQGASRGTSLNRAPHWEGV